MTLVEVLVREAYLTENLNLNSNHIIQKLKEEQALNVSFPFVFVQPPFIHTYIYTVEDLLKKDVKAVQEIFYRREDKSSYLAYVLAKTCHLVSKRNRITQHLFEELCEILSNFSNK